MIPDTFSGQERRHLATLPFVHARFPSPARAALWLRALHLLG